MSKLNLDPQTSEEASLLNVKSRTKTRASLQEKSDKFLIKDIQARMALMDRFVESGEKNN